MKPIFKNWLTIRMNSMYYIIFIIYQSNKTQYIKAKFLSIELFCLNIVQFNALKNHYKNNKILFRIKID